ncbi:MAG: hypothetical protein JW761_10350 [Prolixibacteraceae bacterium]|nr:hypothetical protein [Prolixibacteraceae bacterium]
MVESIAYNRKRWIYIISAFGITWMGLGTTFCYEMGKNGLGNIDWGFIFQTNLPVAIIAGSLLILSFRTKR